MRHTGNTKLFQRLTRFFFRSAQVLLSEFLKGGIGKVDISDHTTDRRLIGYLQFLLRLKVVEISVSDIILG